MFFPFFFRATVSQKRFEISKCAKQVNYCKFEDLNFILYILSEFLTVFDIKKKTFWKKFGKG